MSFRAGTIAPVLAPILALIAALPFAIATRAGAEVSEITVAQQFGASYREKLNLHVDSVEQRTRQPGQVPAAG